MPRRRPILPVAQAAVALMLLVVLVVLRRGAEPRPKFDLLRVLTTVSILSIPRAHFSPVISGNICYHF